MTSTTGSSDKAGRRDRKARLAEELRANLQRRKAQSRARRSGSAGRVPEEDAAAEARDRVAEPGKGSANGNVKCFVSGRRGSVLPGSGFRM